MDTTNKQHLEWREYLSPLLITLLAINTICFGGFIVLLAIGAGGGPLVLLTIGTGLAFGAGLAGALIAGHKIAASKRDRCDSSVDQASDTQ